MLIFSLLNLVNLNYYLSFDVCACFRLSASVCLSVCVCELFNGCIYQRMLVYKVDIFLKRIKMAVLFLIFFWIRSVQNGSNLIKLDQIGFLTNQKMFLYKIVTLKIRMKIAILFWIRLDQICPKWIKLDQIGSNWIKKDQD